MPVSPNKVNFVFGFSNKSPFLCPWYSSGVAYDKLLPVNDKVPATMYGYPLPVVPVPFLLWAIDKVYGTDFSRYCRTIKFGETDMLNRGIDKEGTIYDIYEQELTVANNYSQELQQHISEIFNDARLHPIYDLGVVPCVSSKYKLEKRGEDIAHITSASIANDNHTILLEDGFYGRLFEIIDGIINVKEPSLRLKIKGNISFTATELSNKPKRDDLSSVKLQVCYYDTIPVAPLSDVPSEVLGESSDPISYRRYSSDDPRIVNPEGSSGNNLIYKTLFPLNSANIITENETSYNQNYRFAFVLDNKDDEFLDIDTGYATTDTRGFWIFPNANQHYKIVNPKLVGLGNVNAESLRSRLCLKLDYDEEIMSNLSLAQIDITIEPYFAEGGMPHVMCPIYSLPDMTCLDFIKGLMITEGCYLYRSEDGKIRKREFAALIDNIKKGVCYNVTPFEGSISYDGSDGLSQNNFFMSASDKDEQEETDETSSEGYANNLFDCKISNKHINEKNTISTNPFYPPYIKNVDYKMLPTGDCVCNWKVSELMVFNSSLLNEDDKQIGATLDGEEGKPSLWTLKLGDATGYAHVVVKNSKSYRFSNSKHAVKRLELKEIPTFRFKNNPNYKMLKRIIELGISVKCDCVLPIFDVFNLDWTKPVFIEELDSYFLIVDATWRSENNTTSLSLLKIPADIKIQKE